MDATTETEREPEMSIGNGEVKGEGTMLSGEKARSRRLSSEGLTYIKGPVNTPKAKNPSFRRMLMLNKPEWKQGLLGLLGGIGFGFTNPFYAFIIASLTVDYYKGMPDDQLWHSIKKYVGILVALAVFFLTSNVLQHYNFASAGEQLTKRVRVQMLRSILQYEVGWFDRDENSSGSVCSRLASDANMVNLHPLFILALMLQFRLQAEHKTSSDIVHSDCLQMTKCLAK